MALHRGMQILPLNTHTIPMVSLTSAAHFRISPRLVCSKAALLVIMTKLARWSVPLDIMDKIARITMHAAATVLQTILRERATVPALELVDLL